MVIWGRARAPTPSTVARPEVELSRGPRGVTSRLIAAYAFLEAVGLVGATVPGLKIDGEIGQQLGYLNAAGAGTVNFVILLLVGWAFAHRERAKAILGRVIRRTPRLVPPNDA